MLALVWPCEVSFCIDSTWLSWVSWLTNCDGSCGESGSWFLICATSSLFTTLLVAQIKNQDPLSPQDPSQFVSQLTQLSQVESMQKLT
ncbi:MAG: hypothetical protein EOP37_12495, partial [Rubrivivax sp.]